MEVIKRNGNKESMSFDKITARIRNLCFNNDLTIINPPLIAQKTSGCFCGVVKYSNKIP